MPVADVEINRRSATARHLGELARWAGRTLAWNADQKQFIGDDRANQAGRAAAMARLRDP